MVNKFPVISPPRLWAVYLASDSASELILHQAFMQPHQLCTSG